MTTVLTLDMIQERLDQVQPRRVLRRRQQNEQTPSPKRLHHDAKTPSPRVTPSKRKGVFVDGDTESPVFVAKSFYGKKKTPSAQSTEPCNTSPQSLLLETESLITQHCSPQTVALDDLFKKKMQLATEQGKKSPRIFLSPLRNSSNIGSVNSAKTLSTVGRRRHNSVPEKKSKWVSKSPALTPKESMLEMENTKDVAMGNSRKFFKHKSPQSASKSLGNIVIGKGFKLRFVRRSLNRDYPLGSRDQKTPSRKTISKQKSEVTLLPERKLQRMSTSVCSVTDSTKKNSSLEPKNNVDDCCQNCDSSDHSTSADAAMASGQDCIDSSPHNFHFVEGVSDTLSKPTDADSPASNPEETVHEKQAKHLFPIFSKQRRSQRLAAASPRQKNADDSPVSKHGGQQVTPVRKRFIGCKDDAFQGVLDAGQKQFGAVQCKVCCMVYSAGDPADETMHARFHESTLHALKFPRWKKERVVQEFMDDGSRVVMIMPEDPHNIVKKVEEVNHVMAQELGFADQTLALRTHHKAFLYIMANDQIIGSVIAEPIKEGYRIKPAANSLQTPDNQRPWFCSSDPEPALVGIGRLWVYSPYRKHGIASRLIDCIRQWFEYGIVIDKSRVAFSDPTADGRQFAMKYIGRPNFLVYKYVP